MKPNSDFKLFSVATELLDTLERRLLPAKPLTRFDNPYLRMIDRSPDAAEVEAIAPTRSLVALFQSFLRSGPAMAEAMLAKPRQAFVLVVAIDSDMRAIGIKTAVHGNPRLKHLSNAVLLTRMRFDSAQRQIQRVSMFADELPELELASFISDPPAVLAVMELQPWARDVVEIRLGYPMSTLLEHQQSTTTQSDDALAITGDFLYR